MTLETKQISYYYQDGDTRRYILNDVSVTFEKGRFYTILGQSGSGKTTLLSLLGALDDPQEGQVLLDQVAVNQIGKTAYLRNKIAMVFQAYNLVPYLTAVENVLVAMETTDNPLPDDKQTVAYNLLDFIGISKDKADRLVNQLSGGEQQRIAIARALASNVDVILADEPTGNLDEDRELEIVEIFKQLAHEHGKCVIVVTHSQDIARLSDQAFQLKKGQLSAYE